MIILVDKIKKTHEGPDFPDKLGAAWGDTRAAVDYLSVFGLRSRRMRLLMVLGETISS